MPLLLPTRQRIKSCIERERMQNLWKYDLEIDIVDKLKLL
jgi:hypothetical protein